MPLLKQQITAHTKAYSNPKTSGQIIPLNSHSGRIKSTSNLKHSIIFAIEKHNIKDANQTIKKYSIT